MKKLTVLLATLFVFLSGNAQQILAGIYSGSMYNNSTRMLQKYELALSEYRGKVFGYSYVTFVVNDTFYYGIRRVKGYKNDNNELILTDEELLANNFPESPAKRVRRTATFKLAQEDTITNLVGTWQTNRTRQYYSVGGATKTERTVDSSQSPLVAHLQELKIIAGKPNYQEEAVVKTMPKKEVKKPKDTDVAKRNDRKESEPVVRKTDKNGMPPNNKESAAGKAEADKEAVAAGGHRPGDRAAAENKTGQPDSRMTSRSDSKTSTSPEQATAAVDKPATDGQTTAGRKAAPGDNSPARTESPKKEEGAVLSKTADKPNGIAHTETDKNTSAGSVAANKDDYTIDPTTGDVVTRKPAVAASGNTAPAVGTPGNKAAGNKADGLKEATAKPDESRTANAGSSQPGQGQAAPGKAADQKSGAVAGGNNTPTEGDRTAAAGNNPAAKPVDKPESKEAVAAATLPGSRTSAVIKTLEVVNDSITLSFYDNGVVDGDVISVFVNGQNVVASARLSEVALKKTIHLANFAADSVEVVLVAETLGSIPPNTGLLLVYDGDKRYDVRFSADMKTNASIVFRKGKK